MTEARKSREARCGWRFGNGGDRSGLGAGAKVARGQDELSAGVKGAEERDELGARGAR